MNKIMLLILALGTAFSFLCIQGASAEIRVTPPANWQPAPDNNSTKMTWFQNSTKSMFAIVKMPMDLLFPLYLIAQGLAQSYANQGILESIDQVTFGHSNYGHRYFLNVSSSSDIANASSDALINVKGFLDEMSGRHDIPFKMLQIISEKKGDLYGITLLSTRENFDSILNQIKPTLDSIQLTNSTNIPE